MKRSEIIKQRAFYVGYSDTLYGIKTFKPTDKYPNLKSWKRRMREICLKCKDKNYAKGALKALNQRQTNVRLKSKSV